MLLINVVPSLSNFHSLSTSPSLSLSLFCLSKISIEIFYANKQQQLLLSLARRSELANFGGFCFCFSDIFCGGFFACLCVRACVPLFLSFIWVSCCCFVCLFLLRKNYKNIRQQQARRRRAKVKQRNLIAITNFCRLRTNTQTKAHTHRHTHIETHIHVAVFYALRGCSWIWPIGNFRLKYAYLCAYVHMCVYVCVCVFCVCVLKTKLTTCWTGRQAK